MAHITNAAYKAWQNSLTAVPFADWLEQAKIAGKYWGG